MPRSSSRKSTTASPSKKKPHHHHHKKVSSSSPAKKGSSSPTKKVKRASGAKKETVWGLFMGDYHKSLKKAAAEGKIKDEMLLKRAMREASGPYHKSIEGKYSTPAAYKSARDSIVADIIKPHIKK